MKVIVFYIENDNVFQKKLIRDINESSRSNDFFFCHSFEELVEQLQTIHHNFDIICLIANNTFELERLMSIRHLLTDRKLIFAVPNGIEKALFKEIFRVSPIFIGFLDETYYYTTAVLVKMIQTKNESTQDESLYRR